MSPPTLHENVETESLSQYVWFVKDSLSHNKFSKEMDFSLLNKVSFLYIFVPTTVSIDGPLSS